MQVFGTMQLTAIRRSDLFYGTGESYLFTFYPEFQVTVYTSYESRDSHAILNCDSGKG